MWEALGLQNTSLLGYVHLAARLNKAEMDAPNMTMWGNKAVAVAKHCVQAKTTKAVPLNLESRLY